MRTWILSTLIAMGMLAQAIPSRADGPCPNCQSPGGCCYEEIVHYSCKLVPDVKPIKKTVYECKEVPFCVHQLPKFGDCDCCPLCQACPQFKKVLIKKEVVCGATCATKCVVEKTVERVPVPCCHCGHVPCAP